MELPPNYPSSDGDSNKLLSLAQIVADWDDRRTTGPNARTKISFEFRRSQPLWQVPTWPKVPGNRAAARPWRRDAAWFVLLLPAVDERVGVGA